MTDPHPSPFLSIEAFQAEYPGTLSAGEIATATRLLRVVSDRVRALKSDVDSSAAQQVVFEVVRDAAMYGALEKLSSFQNITSRRQEAGTFDEEAKVVDDYLSPRHKRILGLAAIAVPMFNFPDCDY